MSYKQEINELHEMKIRLDEQTISKLNKRLQVLAKFTYENGFLREEILRIERLREQYKQHIILKPKLDAELRSVVHQMEQLEKLTEHNLTELK